MIGGSSALQNVFVNPVKDPYLRVTLKSNIIVGEDQLLSGVEPKHYKDHIGQVFNNKYITWATGSGVTYSTIYAWDSGGSLLSKVNVNTTAGQRIMRGTFQNSGTTLDLYYIISDEMTENNIYRRSSNNGVSWSGATLLWGQNPTSLRGYDLALIGASYGYMIGTDYLNSAVKGIPIIQRVDLEPSSAIASLPMIMYGEKTTPTNEVTGTAPKLAMTSFGTTENGFLIYESGFANKVNNDGANLDQYDGYWEACAGIDIFRVGGTNIFERNNILRTGSSSEGGRLVKGGLGNSFFYFGINRFLIDNQLIGDEYLVKNLSPAFVLCKLDFKGNLHQRYMYTGASNVAGIIVGGLSSETLSVLIYNGSSQLIRRPVFDYYGSSTDISQYVQSYSNQDNERISLALGNF